MLPTITTTHAIPQQIASAHTSIHAAVAVCQYCLLEIGTFRTKAERAILEARHACKEKLQAGKPSISIPFN